MKQFINDRKTLFKTVVGSFNYNLNDEKSDLDYKVFMLPLFEDMFYNRKPFAYDYEENNADYNCHDIRKLTNLLHKSNINFLEVLFSRDIEISVAMSAKSFQDITSIFSMRESIARMNLPYLYDSCVGSYTNNMKKLLEKYDDKTAMKCYRFLLVLKLYADNEFKSFASAIRYDNGSKQKDLLMAIRHGEVPQEEVLNMVNELFQDLEENYKPIYKSKSFNQDTFNKLEKLVISIIKQEMFR